MAVSIVLAGGRRSELIPRASTHCRQLMFYKAPELSLALSHWMGRDLAKTCPANQCSAYPCEGSERL